MQINREIEIIEIVDAEIIDDACEGYACDKPGRLVIDPFASEVNNETIMVMLCEDCEQIRRDDSWTLPRPAAGQRPGTSIFRRLPCPPCT